jgi:N6-adenosine-specific RNA methylase IME4
MIILPTGMKFGAILIDAPVRFATRSIKGAHRTPQHHYQCASLEEIAAIPLADVALPNCFLFAWHPMHSMPQVAPLMKGWGFTYTSNAFTWVKLNRNGVGYYMGSGYSTRKNTETCFLGRRGWPKRKSGGVRELIVAPVREHSRKPDEIYERIEAFCEGPYLEIFARQQWPGWTCIGNESDKFTRRAA